ncbi:MAG: hypothetical protein EBT12_09120 [Marivivens sp.]|nr:hypothetical protein [Marivivens sp.]
MNRIKHKNPFTAVPNAVLNDLRITFKAKGIYSYLFSKPDGWVFYNQAILNETAEGITSFQSGIKELVKNGWLKKQQLILRNGQFGGNEYELMTELPTIENIHTVTPKKSKAPLENPGTENPVTDNPVTENILTYKEINNKEINKIKSNSINTITKKKSNHYELVLESWNIFAKEFGLSEIRQLTTKRINGIKARQRENGFNIQEIFDCIEESPFLLGTNGNDWKADFDWVFCSPNNWLKIVEGKYRSKGNKKQENDLKDIYEELIGGNK